MKVTLELDRRELTLIRVACLQRLDGLKESNPKSYAETRALLHNVLWRASQDLRMKEAQAEGRAI